MGRKRHVPNEKTGEISRKKINEMEASKQQDTEFKIMVIRIFKELAENFNSIKGHRNQSDMKTP